MSAYIKAISYYLPENKLTNEDINSQFPEWSITKIAEKTGISQRPISAIDEFSSDMAVKAAQKLFEENNISPSDIDFILLCTQSPDYYLPTTACLIQDRLGIPTTAGALDFNLGCSGYVYGLGLAKGLVETEQANNVLLLTSETYSKFIYPQDKSVRTIFGDAAAATLISGDNDRKNSIKALVYGTDGSGAQNLVVKTGGMRYARTTETATAKYDELGNLRTEDALYMNGAEIFVFTLASVPKLITAVLQKAGTTIDDIDLVVFHQANTYMLEALRKKIAIPKEKFFVFLENCGNTVSSTIPIALSEAIKTGRAPKGSKVLIAGFGVGYSWGGAIIEL
ncbi:ketoacyl-ACP synthase III [Pinibacter soli]|uniref:Ketoacyl-ACP synthase III n=1 Tax=Pinibacter soli TaxID=3044211 RepID=A0ABT6R7U6_9BACT|nr:ketoacyl-ACP synthase III [Pinibacter soli]MDI3318637.1 ketoacyl-ACP synthase III [Pinibacter soli]